MEECNKSELNSKESIFQVPDQFEYDGIKYSGKCTSIEALNKIKNFKFRDNDVVLVGYPKSGTCMHLGMTSTS